MTKKQQVKKKSTWSLEPINPVDNSPLFDWPPSVGKVLTWAKKNYFSISIRMVVILLALATWLIATPALESCREFSLGWITYIYVRNLVLRVIIAGGLHLYLYTFRRQDAKLKFDLISDGVAYFSGYCYVNQYEVIANNEDVLSYNADFNITGVTE